MKKFWLMNTTRVLNMPAVMKKRMNAVLIPLVLAIFLFTPYSLAYQDKPLIKSISIEVKEFPNFPDKRKVELKVHMEYEPWGVLAYIEFGELYIQNREAKVNLSRRNEELKEGYPFEGTFVYNLTLHKNKCYAYRIIAKDDGGPPPINNIMNEGTFCTHALYKWIQ